MRRWLLPVAILTVIALSVFGVRHVLEKRAQHARDLAYQSALLSYTEVLRPGMTRRDVDVYLRARNAQFRLMCCVDTKEFSKGVYDELTKIGQEDAPWFCSEENVYVAFQFMGTPHKQGFEADPSDTLHSITIYRWLEGCL